MASLAPRVGIIHVIIPHYRLLQELLHMFLPPRHAPDFLSRPRCSSNPLKSRLTLILPAVQSVLARSIGDEKPKIFAELPEQFPDLWKDVTTSPPNTARFTPVPAKKLLETAVGKWIDPQIKTYPNSTHQHNRCPWSSQE